MVIANEEIKELIIEVPEGHQHLRTTLVLQDGSEITLQEATVANLARAYITVKTHPARSGLRLQGRRPASRKYGFAEWQLLETE
jgi:hypothetical protein